MKMSEKFKINDEGKEYEVRELTGEDMMLIFAMFKPEGKDKKVKMQGFLDRELLLQNFDKILPLATDMPKEMLLKLAPSEMQVIWIKFKNCNAVFFSMQDLLINKLDLNGLWNQAKATLQNFYLKILSSYIDKVLQTAKNGDMEE